MSENKIQIDIVAEDQASPVVAGAAEKMATALRGVEVGSNWFCSGSRQLGGSAERSSRCPNGTC